MGSLTGQHIVIVPAWWPTAAQPGAGSFFMDFASVFAAAGAQVGVIFPELISLSQLRQPGSKPLRPQISFESCTDNIPVVRIRGMSATFGRPQAYMKRFRDWLGLGLDAYAEKFGLPNVIHAGCLLPSGWAATHLDHPLARRVVVTEETGPFSDVMKHPAQTDMVHAAAERAVELVAVSDVLAADMKQHGIARSIRICGNPVASIFLESKVSAETNNPRPRAVFVGRLTRLKGVDELATVIERLDREGHAVDWELIGHGEHAAAHRLVGRLQHGTLTLRGPQDRTTVHQALGNADLFVFPTHVETFGIAVAEALCMGLPVVTTNGTGCAGFINDANGLLCDRDDADSLYNAMTAMLGRLHAYDRRKIAAAARSSFGPDAIAECYAEIFQQARDGS